MSKIKTYYDQLHVSHDAPFSVIKAAYKVLSQTYHPDKYQGGADEALAMMKLINAAYSVLSDADSRTEHDQWIEKQEREQAALETQRMMRMVVKNYAVLPSVAPYSPELSSMQGSSSPSIDLRNSYRINKQIKKIGRLFFSILLATTSAMGVLVCVSQIKLPSLSFNWDHRGSKNDVFALNRAKQLLVVGELSKAFLEFQQLAVQGNVDAQFQLGLMLLNGLGVEKNQKQAVGWFEKAAKQGNLEAQAKLAFMYGAGFGVEQNLNMAFYWSYQAAQQGEVTAEYNLGLMFERGQGIAKDQAMAITWYRRAANQGNARAQLNLGRIYASGQGVKKDLRQAGELYQQAANQGLREAVVELRQLSVIE